MFVSFRITLNRFLRHLALIRCRNLQEARSLATSGGKHGIQCDGHVRFAERWCGPSLNGGPWTRHGNMMKYGNNSSSLTKPPSFVYRQKKLHSRLIYFRVLTSLRSLQEVSCGHGWHNESMQCPLMDVQVDEISNSNLADLNWIPMISEMRGADWDFAISEHKAGV